MDIIANLSDTEVLTLTLIGEARGEPIESIVGVGCVIRNRLHGHPASYKGYSDVCLRNMQFSCWNRDDSNFPFLQDLGHRMADGQTLVDPYLRQCILVANGIVNYDLIDNTKGAEHYLATELIRNDKVPSWAKDRKGELVKGNHTFFSIKEQ